MKHYFKKAVPVLDIDFDGHDPYLSDLGLRAHAAQFDASFDGAMDWGN